MLKRYLTKALSAAAAFAISAASVQAQTELNYELADLFMGFRATAGDGATKCYLVNIGQASTFTSAGSAFTVMNLGNIKTDLDATFPDWTTEATVFWSVSGAVGNFDAVGADPAKTLYASRAQTVPGTPNAPSARWTRGSSSTQTVVGTKMDTMADAFEFLNGDEIGGVKNMSTANSTKARLQNTTDNGSYASYQPGGTPVGNNNGISFAYFNPSIEGNFGSGTASSILELYRMVPGSGGTVGTAGDFVGTFQLDDNANLTFTPAPPSGISTIAFSSATYSQSETDASGKVVLTLNRSGDLSGVSTVNVTTNNGTAMSGTDFTGLSSFPVSFAASETQKTVDITIANLAGFQGNRSFTVSMAAGAGATLGTPSLATVTILEGDTGVQFESATYTVSEAGGNVAVKLVRVGAPLAFTATVNTADDDAFAGTDYTAQTNVDVDFLSTDTEKTLNIPVLNRAGIQGDRDFTAMITGTTNGVAISAPTTTTVTIQDQLVPGSLVFSSATYEQAEPASGTVALAITVSRIGGTDGAASVEVAVTGGTATSPDDFTVPASPVMLSWPNGVGGAQSFDITIKSDAVSETTAETILLALQNAVTATLGTPNTATVTLPAEDSAAPTVTVTTPKANAKISAANVVFGGTATDNLNIARVEVALNGGAPASTTPPSPRTSFIYALTVIPEQGANTAVITAFDDAGNASAPVTINFNFTNVRPQLAGKYNGLLVNAGATEQFNRNGLVAVSVSKTGTFTGKVFIAGVKLPISGIFLTGGDARFGKTKTPAFELIKKAKPANISLGFLSLTLDTGAGMEITGTLDDAGSTTLANISADLAVYTSKNNPVPPLKNVPTTLLDPAREKGKYTGVLMPDALAAGTPSGIGHGTITISKSGVVKITGKAADGSTISYANALSNDNRWPFFEQLYGNAGFLAGEIAFDPMQAQSDASGALTWFKPAGLAKQKLFPNGWPGGILSNFAASKYLVPTAPSTRNPNPPNPDTVLGPGATGAALPTTANIEIMTSEGGLTTDTSDDASLSAKSKVTVIGATAGQTGATDLKTSFTTSNGKMSGSFTHPVSNKKASFSGVAFQKTNTAHGFFLFTPDPATAESGAVDVAEK